MSSLTQTDNFHDLQTPRLTNQTKQSANLKLSFLLTSQTQPVNTNIQAGPQNLEPQKTKYKKTSDKTRRPRSRSRSSSPRRSSPHRGSSSTKKRDHKRRGEGKWVWHPAQLIYLTLSHSYFTMYILHSKMTDSSLVCYFYIIFIAEIFYVFLSLMFFRPHLEI